MRAELARQAGPGRRLCRSGRCRGSRALLGLHAARSNKERSGNDDVKSRFHGDP
jgi:hypothetical protein